MKKYILAALLLSSLSSGGLLASGNVGQVSYSFNAQERSTTTIVGNHNITLSAMDAESSPVTFDPIKMITQPEFAGEVPTNLYLTQQLIVPISYAPRYLSNDIQLGVGTDHTNILDVVAGPLTSDGSFLYVNLLCTGLSVGSATVSFYDHGIVVNQWTINVLDPNASE